jgi:hypothetical protein
MSVAGKCEEKWIIKFYSIITIATLTTSKHLNKHMPEPSGSRGGEYKHATYLGCEPGSSVSIVSGYGLDDRAIEVRSPAEAKIFPLISVS